MQLLLIEHSPHAGGLLRLLVDVRPQGWLPSGDGLGYGAKERGEQARSLSRAAATGPLHSLPTRPERA